jgi:hypothetical protein
MPWWRRNSQVDVFDTNYVQVALAGSFSDTNIPAGYAPFGIQNINGQIFVTYALQDAAKHLTVRLRRHRLRRMIAYIYTSFGCGSNRPRQSGAIKTVGRLAAPLRPGGASGNSPPPGLNESGSSA